MKTHNSIVWAVFCWHLMPMITCYVAKPLHIFKVFFIQQLVLECVFCCLEVIHAPGNILGYHVVWLFQFVTFPVCGRFGFWPFRSVAIRVCDRFGLWPFRFVAVPVCGHLGLWPFRLWPFRFVAVVTCYQWYTPKDSIVSNRVIIPPYLI